MPNLHKGTARQGIGARVPAIHPAQEVDRTTILVKVLVEVHKVQVALEVLEAQEAQEAPEEVHLVANLVELKSLTLSWITI